MVPSGWSQVVLSNYLGSTDTAGPKNYLGSEPLVGAELAAWDDDEALVRFVEERAGDLLPGEPEADRYAASVTGTPRKLSRPERGVWKRRLLIDAGLVEPPPVVLARLPEEACTATRELWPQIQLLVQARVLGGMPATDPFPLSRRFLRGWARMSERAVREAMEELEWLGYVERAGTYPARRGVPGLTWRVRLAGEEDA